MPFFTHAGQRLYYREQGAGPLLLILPGNTASSACHSGELAYFGQRYHAVGLDFLGTGRSARLTEWPERWWEMCASQVAALVEHINEGPAFLVGTSGGAVVALWAAILYPPLVRAVIGDSEIEFYPADRLAAQVSERLRRTPDQVDFWRQAHGEDWAQVVEADSAMLLRFARAGGDFFRGQLGSIRCPVLLTASLADEMLPGVAGQLPAMARQIPDCRVYFSNRGTHPMMWSRSEEFRRISDLFLAGV